MKAAYGHCRQVRKLITTGDAIIEVQIPAEDYVNAVQLLDGKQVLVTIAPDDVVDAYGIVITKPRKSFAELKPSAQVSLRCKDATFREWMKHGIDEEECITEVRLRCGVESRAELDKPGPAQDVWLAIETAYIDFQYCGGRNEYPEAR